MDQIFVLLLTSSLLVPTALGGGLDQDSAIERPMYLFRGWNAKSGGANADSIDLGKLQLNAAQGIVPHAFLQNQKPTHLFQHEDYAEIIEGHIFQDRVISPCSSWATDLQTAISWAGADEDSQIAMVDTSLLEPYNHVYHVPTLARFGIVDSAAAELAPDEYLIYGPVRAPAFHSVSVRELMNLGLELRGKDGNVTDELVTSVLRVAEAFQSRPAKRSGNVNAILSVFAIELSRRVQRTNVRTRLSESSLKSEWTKKELAIITKGCKRILDIIPSGSLRLVNHHMYTANLLQVTLAKELLLHLEQNPVPSW